ncbi:LTA synthase family protein [Jeotgalibacillus sp. S-D1]|uniref:LTA synthase family protein n=1 Tax=Jeotgalibacillus sp. S-D1 TaxID=2552189 RepID=UPI00105A5D07|nr:LTA synthase family protein [Jeotgalibacillus sp. S-D1]TDL31356.1 LTA synthase family protein [Jeotgalibacillus sp. S-D1]
MKRFAGKYGDYILYVALLLAKLYAFSIATRTNFDFILLIVSLGSIFLLSFWILSIAPRKRRWMLVGFSILITFLFVSNIWYYRYFTDFLSVSLIVQLPQMGDVGGGMQDLVYWSDFLFFLDTIILMVFLWFDRKRTFGQYPAASRIKAVAAAGTAGVLLFITPLVLNASDRNEWLGQDSLSNIRSYYKMGLIGYHGLDLVKEIDERWIEPASLSNAERKRVTEYFQGKESPTVKALEEKPNIIVIQLESFQSSLIGKEIDGQELTPNLNKFKDQTMYFPNFYHQAHQGRTSDAEFIVNTSFYPLKSGSVYTRYPDHSFDSLPEQVKKAGYETAAFHAFRPDFWNRDQMYENFGFDHFYSIEDFPPGEEIGMTLNDRDFFLSGADKLSEMDKPFYGFMVALTSHTPYEYPEDKQELDLSSFDEGIIRSYYHTIHYVDSAFGDMVTKLKEEDLWDNSLIVVYGDHDSGLYQPGRDMAIDENAETSVDYLNLGKKVPLFIKKPNQQEGETVEKSGGQIDIAPTVLSLLGIEPEYMMGNSLVNDKESTTVFRDGSFVTDDVYYQEDLSGVRGAGQCYSLETEEKISSAECEPWMEKTALELRLSDLVIRKNAIYQLKNKQ